MKKIINYFLLLIPWFIFIFLIYYSKNLNIINYILLFTMYVNEATLEWLSSLQKAQSAKMKYTVYSPDGSYKNIIYDGGIVIDDVVYECSDIKENSEDRVMLINIEFSTSDRRVIKS